MENVNTAINDVMQAGLQDRYKIIHIPFQGDSGWHSAQAYVKDITIPNTPTVLLKVQQYKRLNPREAFGLQVMSHYPGEIRIPKLIEEGEIFTIQEFCPGTMLDSTKHAVPESYATELGKLIAWQMFPPADIQILLKQKMIASNFSYYPNEQFPVRIIATGKPKNVYRQIPGDVLTDENERDEFIKILSIQHSGFDKGDWRLSNTLYNATVKSEVFYSVDYGYSYIITKNESRLFEKRVAVFDLMLLTFGEVFSKRMINAFIEKSKTLLPH